MIEEFMLLANRRVAEFCGRRMQNGRRVQRTMVYRVHDEPNEEKLTRFREFITRFGYSFRASKGSRRGQADEPSYGRGARPPRGQRHYDARCPQHGQGVLYHRQHRPLRIGLSLLYALHFAHTPLSRHDGAPASGALPCGRQVGRQTLVGGDVRICLRP